MDSIEAKIAAVTKGFRSGKTRPYSYRRSQLQLLGKAFREFYDAEVAALHTDLNRCSMASKLTEAEHLVDLVDYTLSNLKAWMRDDPKDVPALLLPANTYVRYEPLGVGLIMGSWNFPFDVTLGPLISAIAAGNAAIVKPSEMSVASAAVIEKIVSVLDPECYQVVTGGPEVAADLVAKKWDFVFFTGSTEKGRLVAQAAARHLTPCLLELGGKNPAIVDRDANLVNAALRIVQGRTLNVGQICLCPEYVFVHESVAAEFERLVLSTLASFYGDDAKKSGDYGRIINTGNTQRIAKLLENHGGEVLYGGHFSVEDRYVEPTVIKNPSLNSALMREEIFGPILSLFTFSEIGEVIKFINDRDRPLAIYYCGSENKDEVMTRTTSGGFLQNEVAFHYAIPDLPFGGVGPSGTGRYHGEEGFRCLSNAKSVLEKDTYNGFPISLRYPPHTTANEASFLRLKGLVSFSAAEMKKSAVRAAVVSAVGFAFYKGYLGWDTWEQVKSASSKVVEAIGLKSLFAKK